MKTVFVSSTFRDMHFERDLIHEQIAPKLNETAQKYGDHVSFCDLRWGVNTLEMDAENSSRKVLNFCLDEIDRCRPYMVVFIGYRYGWIPEEALLEQELRGRELMLDDLERSVTELEIEYGALSRPESLTNVLFYFRKIEGEPPAEYLGEDDHHEEKLNDLKRRIVNLTGGRVKEYSVTWNPEKMCLEDTEDLASLLFGDLTEVFLKDWKEKENLSEMERILQGQFAYATQKAYPLSRRNDLIQEYLSSLMANKIVAIRGESGSGKSSILSGLIEDLRTEGADVLPIFCGTSNETNDAFDVLRLTVRYLQRQLGLPDRDEAEDLTEWKERLIALGAQYNSTAEKDMYLVIDAIDQLFPDELRDQMQFVLPEPGDHIHYILSMLPSFPIRVPAEEIFDVPQMGEDDRVQIIQGILSETGRELDDYVIRAIISKEAAVNPLYSGLLMMRLMMLKGSDFQAILLKGDGMEGISRYQRELVEAFPDTLEEAIPEVIHAASERIGGALAERAVTYIALSRNGLRQEEIFALLKREGLSLTGLDFSMFVQYLRDFFLIRDDGRYDFTHGKIREGVLAELGEEKEACLNNLFEVFSALPDDDPVKCMELGYHAIKANRREAIYQLARREVPVKMALANDLREQSLEDGGEYVISLIRDNADPESRGFFVTFVALWLYQTFLSSNEEAIINKKIMEAGIHGCQGGSLQEAKLDMNVADCCVILSGNNMLELARNYYARAQELCESCLAKGEHVKIARNQYLQVLALAADNNVKTGNYDHAKELAMKGIELSEQYHIYNDIISLYTNAVAADYWIAGKKILKRKLFIFKKKVPPEVETALATAERGEALIGDLYRRGALSEKGIIGYAMLKKQYGDVIELLQEKENVGKIQKIHQEAAEIGMNGRIAWSIPAARMRADLYQALHVGITRSEEWSRLDEATAYAEKQLDAAMYLHRQTKTLEAKMKLIEALCDVGMMYLATRTEPEEGDTEGYLQWAYMMASDLAEAHMEQLNTAIINAFAQSTALLGMYKVLCEDYDGMNMILKARALSSQGVNHRITVLKKAWKAQGITFAL